MVVWARRRIGLAHSRTETIHAVRRVINEFINKNDQSVGRLSRELALSQYLSGNSAWPFVQSITSKIIPRRSISFSRPAACFLHRASRERGTSSLRLGPCGMYAGASMLQAIGLGDLRLDLPHGFSHRKHRRTAAANFTSESVVWTKSAAL